MLALLILRWRRTFERLTFDPGANGAPVWAPDGSRVAYLAEGRQGGPGIHLRAADGTGDGTRLTTGIHIPKSISPDGKVLVFAGSGNIGAVALDGKTAAQALITTPAQEDSPKISSDGRWMAFETDETGQAEIFVRPFPDVDKGRWRVSTGGGFDPLWSPDGRRLFYRIDRSIMAVEVAAGLPSDWGVPEKLLEGDGYLFNSGPTHFDISPDGRRFLMIKEGGSDESAAPPQIIVVHNWFEELKRLVPTR